MLVLPPVDEGFTRKQLFLRLAFYNLSPLYKHRMTKEDLIRYIERFETLQTRSIEDDNHE